MSLQYTNTPRDTKSSKNHNPLETSKLPKLKNLQFGTTAILILTTGAALLFAYSRKCIESRKNFAEVLNEIQSQTSKSHISIVDQKGSSNPAIDSVWDLLTPTYPHTLSTIFDLNNIQDVEIKTISWQNIESLKNIHLVSSKLTDESLKSISPLKKVETLELANAQITGRGFQHITHFPLKSLVLEENPLASKYLPELIKFKELVKLDLSECNLDDSAIPHIAQIKSLIELDLKNNPISGSNLHFLSKLPNLRTLSLTVSDLEIKELTKLIEQLPSLTLVNIYFDDKIEGLNKLREMAEVRERYFSRTRINVLTPP